jgi:hypothetical protein
MLIEKIRAWIMLHAHAKELADALHELEDEASIKLWHDPGTERSKHVVMQAQRALIKSGRGVK